MNRKIHSSCFRFIILLSTIIFTAYPSVHEANQPSQTPLDFSLKTLDGETICLKSYRGKKIVHLMFWATWCPHCLMEMPKLKKLHDLAKNKPYEIMAINVGPNDSPKRIKKIKEQYNLPCEILLDKNAGILKGCKVFGVPYHIIIDKEGMIIDRFNELPNDLTTFLNKMFSLHPSQ